MNIFDLAKDNSLKLIDLFKSDNVDLKVQTLIGEIKSIKGISLNSSLEDTLSILVSKNIKNITALANQTTDLLNANGHLISTESVKESHLNKYYSRRINFENQFTNGQLFKYAALNLGNLGAKKYGEFCIFLEHDKILNICCLKQDSLNYFDGNIFKFEEFEKDLCLFSDAEILCYFKFKNNILTIKELKELINIICNDSDYIEIIIEDEITDGLISNIFISQSDYYFFLNNLYELYSSKISAMEKIRLIIFTNILELCKKSSHNLIIV